MRKPAHILLGISLIFLCSAAAVAADLLQVYQKARENDPIYAEAKARYEAGQEKLSQGRAGLLPTMAFSATSNMVNREIVNPALPEQRFRSHQYALNLNQPLFRWQNWLQYEQGGLQVAQAEADFVQAKQDLLLRTAQAYFDVLLAQEQVNSLQAQMTAIAQQLEQAKAYFEVGTATITDTHEAQARHDLAEAQLIAAKSDLEIKQAALQMLTGDPVDGLKPLKTDAFLLSPQPSILDHWVKAAEDRHPAVQSRQAGAEVAKLEASKQQAGHYPTLDLVGTVARSRDNMFLGGGWTTADIEQRVLGLQLNIPLFQGGIVSSRAREAAAAYLAAKAQLDSTRRQAAQSARQSYLGVVNGLAQVKALNAASESSKLALEANKLGYELGLRVNIDVLNAEQQVQTTRRDLAKARFDTLMAQLRLKSAVGALLEEDLSAINALLDSSLVDEKSLPETKTKPVLKSL